MLAVNLAVLCVQAGRRVLLVDADGQQTSTAFYATRVQRPALVEMAHRAVTGLAVRDAVQAAARCDDILIDCGGWDTVSQRAALSVADVLLAPFPPRAADVWTLDTLEALVTELRTVHPALRACTCLCLADARGPTTMRPVPCWPPVPCCSACRPGSRGARRLPRRWGRAGA